MNIEPMRRVAERAAKKASVMIRRKYGKEIEIKIKNKNPKDLVSEVDLAAEKIIVSEIRKVFPYHTIHSEEMGIDKQKHPLTWVIDPIDGTSNFIHHIPCFCVSIALVDDTKALLGVVADPMTDRVYVGVRNKGAWMNGRRIHVSRTRHIEKAFASVEWWSRDLAHQPQGIQTFSVLARHTNKIRYISGTVWELMQVATGTFDLVTCETSFLDIAASLVIVQEAGGVITDESGHTMQNQREGVHRIVAANRVLNKKVVEILP